nr:hypothetical protein [Megasphaera massiliensis]
MLPNLPAKLMPVFGRHHNIDYSQLNLLLLKQTRSSFPVGSLYDAIALFSKDESKQSANSRVIIRN